MKNELRNPGMIQFVAKILDSGSGGAYVEFPFDVPELFNTRGRVPVKTTFDGVPYRGIMVRMGTERHILIILKEIREKIHKTFGDEVMVEVSLDEEPRVIVPPADVQEIFMQNADAKQAFEKLSYTHQREYMLSIEAAKKEETRLRRIQKMVGELTHR